MLNKRHSLFILITASILLAACSSNQETASNKVSPIQTKPRLPVVDVNGAIPRFEPPSRIGNTDYDVLGQHYQVWNGIDQYDVDGVASWYGPGFHGKYTSNGELYNQEDISAAHKNLPLPSYVRVTNLDNGKRLIVRVNDRGPFHGDRVLDLSKGAASRLGILQPGTAHVHLELIHPPRPENANQLIAKSQSRTIQVLATNDVMKAQKIADEVKNRYGVPSRVVSINQMYKLHLGPLEKPKADQLLAELRRSGFAGAFYLN